MSAIDAKKAENCLDFCSQLEHDAGALFKVDQDVLDMKVKGRNEASIIVDQEAAV